MTQNLERFIFCFLLFLLMVQLFSCHQNGSQTSKNNKEQEDNSLTLTYQDTLLKYLSLQD